MKFRFFKIILLYVLLSYAYMIKIKSANKQYYNGNSNNKNPNEPIVQLGYPTQFVIPKSYAIDQVTSSTNSRDLNNALENINTQMPGRTIKLEKVI